MPSPILAALEAEVAEATTVMDSATALITGFAARVQAAVDAALANGATADELAPVQAEIDALNAAGDALAAAVVANT
jgi:hypothetical protein